VSEQSKAISSVAELVEATTFTNQHLGDSPRSGRFDKLKAQPLKQAVAELVEAIIPASQHLGDFHTAVVSTSSTTTGGDWNYLSH